jgi:hypothetical protein
LAFGQVPLILTTYDATGKAAAGLSGRFENKIIDRAALPRSGDPLAPVLGVQIDDGNTTVKVLVRRRLVEKLFIDNNGVGFAEPRRTVAKGGPFITLTFRDPLDKVISLSSVSVTVARMSGGALTVVPRESEITLVGSVPREPPRVSVPDWKGGRNWSANVYPMYRSSEPGLFL